MVNDKFPCKDCGKLLSADDENWDYCDECGEPVCNDCGTVKDDEKFCSECLEKG